MKSVLSVMFAAFASCSGAHAEEALPPAPPQAAEVLLNRITLYGGYGPDGLYVEQSRKSVTVAPFMGPIGGVGYSRVVWDRWSVTAQGFVGLTPASRTFIGVAGVGYDW